MTFDAYTISQSIAASRISTEFGERYLGEYELQLAKTRGLWIYFTRDLLQPMMLRSSYRIFQINDQPIIVLDEFDRIFDTRTKSMMTELIKSLSDHTVHAKLVLVGIANNAGELIAKHASISRALKQVQMPRLSLTELEKTVSSRYKKCDLKIADEVLLQIAFLSRGLPYYAHLLGRHTAVHAIDARRTNIMQNDLIGGLKTAVEEVDQTITEDYLKATVSQKPDETLFEAVLVACALADSDDLGQFQQAAVAQPLSAIVPKDPPYTAATFAFHMNEFCEYKRKQILQRSGETRNYRYSFTDAMMQPYVIIRALQTGRLKRDTFDKFIIRRQRSFPFSLRGNARYLRTPFGRHAFSAALCGIGLFQRFFCSCRIYSKHVLFLAGGDTSDFDGVAYYVGGALLAFGSGGHQSSSQRFTSHSVLPIFKNNEVGAVMPAGICDNAQVIALDVACSLLAASI